MEAAIHLGNVTVNENGTLFTANTIGNVSGSQTVFRYLYGSGTITNDTADSSSQRMIVERYGDFSGRITGKIYYYSPGYMRFTGTESTFPVFVVYKNYGHGFQEGYGGILGIKVAEDAVGCDKVAIEPHAVAGITWAKGHLDTPKGRISVSWRLEDGRLSVEKDVPPGVSLAK